jgi:D-glycero-D-manno-heptose 1,7-bisphosphate phosphatase
MIQSQPRKAAFLDRDGVLVEILRDAELGVLYTAFHPNQLRLTRGALEALRRLRELGYLRIVVTNQPGAAKGHFPEGQIERMHQRLRELLEGELDAIYHCPHHPDGGPGGDQALVRRCDCRKPKPGMLLQAARDHGLDLSLSAMIGDSPDDVRAGAAAGARTILLNGGRCELCPNRGPEAVRPDATVASLSEAVDFIANSPAPVLGGAPSGRGS